MKKDEIKKPEYKEMLASFECPKCGGRMYLIEVDLYKCYKCKNLEMIEE